MANKITWNIIKEFENEPLLETCISTKLPRNVGYTQPTRKTCASCKFLLKPNNHSSTVQLRDCTSEFFLKFLLLYLRLLKN